MESRKEKTAYSIAHRGFSGCYPENTMLAFRKAVELDCDGIELDVHLTKDNQVVIIHDEAVDRTTDKTGYVREFTLAELRKCNAAAGFPDQGSQGIPSLEEYFDFIRDNCLFTNIELKNGVYYYPGMEQKVIELIHRFQMEDRILFSSFNHISLVQCKRLAPDIPCGLLTDKIIGCPGIYAKAAGAEYFHPNYQYLSDGALEDLTRHGIHVNAWTVNDMESMRQAAVRGVHGIITNYPDRLNKVLQENS